MEQEEKLVDSKGCHCGCTSSRCESGVFHPHGPNTRFYPKEVEGGKDMCFIPFDHILVKLVEPSSLGRASRTREIYNLSAEVMDFIEETHIHHVGLRPGKAE
ncbi:hypothetical protein KUCAC02_003882 [Chaenocephalus aceratus]|uniref:Uncharacterized protein n=1 Tax=Chaenocephalus aceratus TaxID=36190 RepID=A0ACB9WMK8_CHAAC|nr:hypothetical protein KUCAC02_003882 [Chaenocephalus aceratus]